MKNLLTAIRDVLAEGQKLRKEDPALEPLFEALHDLAEATGAELWSRIDTSAERSILEKAVLVLKVIKSDLKLTDSSQDDLRWAIETVLSEALTAGVTGKKE